MVYKTKRAWAAGFRASVSPEIAGEQFDRLASEGRLNAEEVVKENTPVDAPLHNEFEWNNDKAAELFRKRQARDLMSHLVFVNVDEPEQKPQKCYFKIDTSTNNYEPIQEIVKSVDKTKLLIQTAYRDMISYQNKFAGVLQTCGANVDVDAVLKKLKESA